MEHMTKTSCTGLQKTRGGVTQSCYLTLHLLGLAQPWGPHHAPPWGGAQPRGPHHAPSLPHFTASSCADNTSYPVAMLMEMSVVRLSLLVGVAVVQVGWALVQTPSLKLTTTKFNPAVDCKDIKFADPSRSSAVREAVLRAMCVQAAPHVDLDDKLKQFAVFLLHRDHFDDVARWHSGDAQDVLADQYWVVNEVQALASSKYHWYTHGLPMWPLPHQALPNTTSSKKLPTIKKKKPVDWPNYGLATPIYYASNAWRNQAWSVEEFFQQEKKKSPFKSHKDFHKLAKDLVEGINGQKVESYGEWPFLKYSLVPMIKSMVTRNKGLCPDELYVFTRLSPCYPGEEAHLTCAQAALQARTLLTQAACRTTDVIVGYAQNYNNNAL